MTYKPGQCKPKPEPATAEAEHISSPGEAEGMELDARDASDSCLDLRRQCVVIRMDLQSTMMALHWKGGSGVIYTAVYRHAAVRGIGPQHSCLVAGMVGSVRSSWVGSSSMRACCCDAGDFQVVSGSPCSGAPAAEWPSQSPSGRLTPGSAPRRAAAPACGWRCTSTSLHSRWVHGTHGARSLAVCVLRAMPVAESCHGSVQ